MTLLRIYVKEIFQNGEKIPSNKYLKEIHILKYEETPKQKFLLSNIHSPS